LLLGSLSQPQTHSTLLSTDAMDTRRFLARRASSLRCRFTSMCYCSHVNCV